MNKWYRSVLLPACLMVCGQALAAEFQVGPGRPYATLQALTAAVTLHRVIWSRSIPAPIPVT